MKVSAIIPAAGLGLRMGSDIPKQFLLLDGKPILHHTLSALERCSAVDEIVLVVSEKEVEPTRKQMTDAHPKVAKVSVGGKERQDSVGNGLQSLDPATDIVIVHDGVRPFVSPDLINATIEAALECGAAITAIPVTATLNNVNADGVAERPVDREGLWPVQTPQTFRFSLLTEAFAKARADRFYGTDEGALIEYMGKEVKVIAGSEFNIKITQTEDLALAETIAAQVKANGPGARAGSLS